MEGVIGSIVSKIDTVMMISMWMIKKMIMTMMTMMTIKMMMMMMIRERKNVMVYLII